MDELKKALNLRKNFIVTGKGSLASKFAVTKLATHSMAAVGLAMQDLLQNLELGPNNSHLVIDRRLASLWFGFSLQPIKWSLPPIWDAIAGDYQTQDGWIRLHTNLTRHRDAALSVLNVPASREQVAKAVLIWQKDELEDAIVSAGGVAASMKSRQQWLAHPQGQAIATQPLIDWSQAKPILMRTWQATQARPLAGLRVLDLTRVLAGPVASRTLAGFGASVLRIDPFGWQEPIVVPDITLGKKCARLDLHKHQDREVFTQLLTDADVLIHGYRPGALDKLGFTQAFRHSVAPSLIEVSLNAYGYNGPWSGRRGFDSLVQMSSGIAHEGLQWANQNKPFPLPVQALDHATGYLLAASAIRAISMAISQNQTSHARLSLARTAELLCRHPQKMEADEKITANAADYSATKENTPWGLANRLLPAIKITNTEMTWDSPSCELGSHPACW